MVISLSGKVALITGASSGIGKAIATSLAAAGARVVINHSSPTSYNKALEVHQAIIAQGGSSLISTADVSKEEEVLRMFEEIDEAFGSIDILVNNAGLQDDAPFHEMTLQQWNHVIGVNLTGQFLCAREAIKRFLNKPKPLQRTSRGIVLHISSVHEDIPWAGHINYAASKGGVKMLMQSLAQEYGQEGIRALSICPGATRTPINKSEWSTKAGMDKMLDLIPYNRIGEPEEVGNLAVFLCSDFADYITGTSIFIDGGMKVYESFATGG